MYRTSCTTFADLKFRGWLGQVPFIKLQYFRYWTKLYMQTKLPWYTILNLCQALPCKLATSMQASVYELNMCLKFVFEVFISFQFCSSLSFTSKGNYDLEDPCVLLKVEFVDVDNVTCSFICKVCCRKF